MLGRHLYEFGYALTGCNYSGKLPSTPSRNEVPRFLCDGGGRDVFIDLTLRPRESRIANVGLNGSGKASATSGADMMFLHGLRSHASTDAVTMSAVPSEHSSELGRKMHMKVQETAASKEKKMRAQMKSVGRLVRPIIGQPPRQKALLVSHQPQPIASRSRSSSRQGKTGRTAWLHNELARLPKVQLPCTPRAARLKSETGALEREHVRLKERLAQLDSRLAR